MEKPVVFFIEYFLRIRAANASSARTLSRISSIFFLQLVQMQHIQPNLLSLPEKEQQVDKSDINKAEPTIGIAGTPNSWVLQIASYRFEAHAKERRNQLLEKGYAAFTRTVETKRGKMTRLYVGPNLEKRKIVAAKKAIDEMLGVETVVMKSEP